MKQVWTMFSLLVILIAAVFVLSEFLSTNQKIVAVLFIAISMLLFSFLTTMKGFLVLVIEIIMLGIYLVITNWTFSHSIAGEVWGIVIQMASTTVLICLWLFISLVKNNLSEIKQLKGEIRRLQRTDAESGLLTYDEFIERLKIMVTGMNRRHEKGYFIFIPVNTQKREWASETIIWSISREVIRSVRDRYDLVTKVNNNLLIVALQNTDREGCEIVKRRMMDRINELFEESVQTNLLSVSDAVITSDWAEVKRQLMLVRNEEGA